MEEAHEIKEMATSIIKTEVQSNGEILLYYVDENGDNQQGIVTTIENIEQGNLDNYVIEAQFESEEESNIMEQNMEIVWEDEDIRRLLIFYNDNKETFLNGLTEKRHLWTVACKTMLIGKNENACEEKLTELKKQYATFRVTRARDKCHDWKRWTFYAPCELAFSDDEFVLSILAENDVVPNGPNVDDASKKRNAKKTRVTDKNVEKMLMSYLVNKQRSRGDTSWQKTFWFKLAIELGEDAEYWHKRFLNYKQHYIRLIEKRNEQAEAEECNSWPYMNIFEEIYRNDYSFQRKYGKKQEVTQNHEVTSQVTTQITPKLTPQTTPQITPQITSQITPQVTSQVNSQVFAQQAPPIRNLEWNNSQVFAQPAPPMRNLEWNETEKTVLVKYCFDCSDEFEDPSIPNSVLWKEISRLLDKMPDECKSKYEQFKTAHLDLYFAGGYDLRTRKPLAILFDNIIAKETEKQLWKYENTVQDNWETEAIDNLVNYFYENIEVFKDDICHFVCYAAIAKKLGLTVAQCRQQWEDLVTLYKKILEYKKQDPELQIDWRYIDIFDRVFDYGMDVKLLEGYEKKVEEKQEKLITLPGKKEKDIENEEQLSDNASDDDDFDPDKSSGKKTRGRGDQKQIKILEYYLKNKDKFSQSGFKKQTLWGELADQIGLSPQQCAHRFRNLKQVYTSYVEREINKPDKPILWPYYNMCKKVFGYRNLKNKLKSGKVDDDDWPPKDIKRLISHYAENYEQISENTDDVTIWAAVANEIGKSEMACRDKFLDLRKSFRKIQTMVKNNPESKINWKYYKMFRDIHAKECERTLMDVDSFNELEGNIKTELQDDEYQCIIVLPEGADLTDLNKGQVIVKGSDERKKLPMWRIKTKRELLKHVYEYIQAQEGKPIDPKEMWAEIGTKFPETTPKACQNMYIKLKKKYKDQNTEDRKKFRYTAMFMKIFALKPKYERQSTNTEVVLKERSTYTDLHLPLWKVEKALKHYLDNLEEFIHPKYDNKLAWTELGKIAALNPAKIFRKINYLKQFFNSETREVNGEKFEFADLLASIVEKELVMKVAIANEPKPISEDDSEVSWTDYEVEQLLLWYLDNLDKFKNPKFVSSYLWMEASNLLNKSAVECSKKMTEIRSQYKTIVKENPEILSSWRFYELCQKIYGTGKKNTQVNGD